MNEKKNDDWNRAGHQVNKEVKIIIRRSNGRVEHWDDKEKRTDDVWNHLWPLFVLLLAVLVENSSAMIMKNIEHDRPNRDEIQSWFILKYSWCDKSMTMWTIVLFPLSPEWSLHFILMIKCLRAFRRWPELSPKVRLRPRHPYLENNTCDFFDLIRGIVHRWKKINRIEIFE